jgi:hypothetical protein
MKKIAIIFFCLTALGGSIKAQHADVLKEIYSDFNHGQQVDANTEWMQAIRIIEPACRSEVKGMVTVKFTAKGMDEAKAFLWQQPVTEQHGKWGHDVNLTPKGLKTGKNGTAFFTFNADEFPAGPMNVRIYAQNKKGEKDIFELQLYNKGGVKWNQGIPDTIPEVAKGLKLVFEDDFNESLSISNDGRNARYNAHKPRGGKGDFSGWPFSDIDGPCNPFGQIDDYLVIKARKTTETKGSTGLIASVNDDGKGFWVKAPCYLECRFTGQSAPGTWPAFWTLNRIDEAPGDELDIVEAYGGVGKGNPNHPGYSCVSHYWSQKNPDGSPLKSHSRVVPIMELGGKSYWSTTFHTYGIYIGLEETVYYFDDIAVLRHPTNSYSRDYPHLFLINYAIGGISGWPIDLERFGNGSDMYVDFVRVYALYNIDYEVEKPLSSTQTHASDCKRMEQCRPLPKWITADDSCVNNPNTWIAFRKDFYLTEKTKSATAQIAVDSKYWLWINGNLAVFEGGLKRGPNANDTYYDKIDLLPYLNIGKNQIAILLWYFGKNGFSHNDSGKSGLLFNLPMTDFNLVSDTSWLSRIHPSYLTAGEPFPNWRLPESNIRFDANWDMADWLIKDCAAEYHFQKSKEIACVGGKPWNNPVERPIPLWKDFGVKTAETKQTQESDSTYECTAYLPYNMQMTPIINVFDPLGGKLISIETDHTFAGGDVNLRAEYITRKGLQEYESPGWLSGQKIILKVPKGVDIRSVKYRETGYDTEQTGRFYCSDDFFVRFWEKGLRTLYINMRDSYFDCPDRERAQWWGDVVVLMGESFYTFSPSTHLLMKKAIHELVDWQRADSTLFSPVPAGNYSDELPAQMLASVGYYGFWNYYINTGDIETIAYVYPAIKKYLGIWKLDNTGLTAYRKGGWGWGDWGYNIDQRLLLAAWHYLALKGISEMAGILGYSQDIEAYHKTMEQIKTAFNYHWNSGEYRHSDYSGETDDRVQALAVLSGIADKEKYERIFEVFKKHWNASPYMEKYVMEALFVMGKGEYALYRVKERFSPMVNHSEHTTLFEGWDIGNKDFGGGTTNHAWSGGAIAVIGQYVCGIYPLEAGYKTVKIAPNPLFREASITVPSVAGNIYSEFKRTDKDFLLNVSIPENMNAIVTLPERNFEKIIVNGKELEANEYLPDNPDYVDKSKRTYRFPAGNYSIRCLI